MQITLSAEGQLVLPAEVKNSLQQNTQTRVEIVPGSRADEWILRPVRVRREKLFPLRGKISSDIPPFDLQAFRDEPKDYAKLRD